MRAGIALGSNLGDRFSNLRTARSKVEALGGVRPPIIASAIYETEPVGCEAGAANFLNAAIEVEYGGKAQELLRELIEIEKSLGRLRTRERNTSRTIDLDLLYFGETKIETHDLQLPHPRITKREFVLRPLADIRPELVLPGQTQSVHALLDRLNDRPEVVRSAAQW